MAVPKSLNTREWYSYDEDNAVAHTTAPIFQYVGGLVGSSAPTYTDGDAAVLSLDTSGRLRCILDGATISIGGDVQVDVSAFKDTSGAQQDAFVFQNDEDLSATTEWWQGVGGYDETSDRFRALPIATDDLAMPSAAQFVPVGGEYNAAPITYTDGDATILQTDVNGYLKVTSSGATPYENPSYDQTEDEASASEFTTSVIYGYDSQATATNQLRMVDAAADNAALSANPTGLAVEGIYRAVAPTYTDGDAVLFHFTSDGKLMTDTNVTLTGLDYVDDSTEFTVATSKGVAVMGLATTDQVDAGDIGALKMNVHRQLAITSYDGTGTETFVVGNPGMVSPTDGTNYMPMLDAVGRAGYFIRTDGTNTAPTMDVVGRAGYQYITDGTNTMPTMDVNTRAGYHILTDGSNDLGLVVGSASFGSPYGNAPYGIYEATPTTYVDGEAVPFHFDANGRLITDANVTLTGLDYTDDSAEFTVATSKVLALGGLATSDTVDANDIGILRMSTARELFITQTTHDNLNLNANVQQGDADVAIGNALYTRVTDGTNTMPTMDAVGRAGYTYVTDGTNTQPTLDAVGRAGFFQLTDGTNTMPTMDVNTRAGYVQITDGTEDWSIDASGYGQVDIAAQSLTALKVSKDAAANLVTNPIWTELTDGTNPLGTVTNPIHTQEVGGTGLAGNPFVVNTNVASAGTPNDHDFNTALSQNASNVVISNTHGTGTLEVDSSWNGAAFTGVDMTIGPGETLTLTDVNIDTLRVDADTPGTTYWVRAW